jgi:hypothetical protein
VALRTATQAEKVHREGQTVELVWTGPDTEVHPFRRTEQAILQVLDAARQRITLVSFAVYRILSSERQLRWSESSDNPYAADERRAG